MKESFALLCCLVALVSCSSLEHRADSEAAKGFHVMTQEELHLDMQAMAREVSSVAFVSLDDKLSLTDKRDRIVPMLDTIQAIALSIDQSGAPAGFSVVNRYMGAFLYDVSIARDFAIEDPPNLIPAQRLIKSCLACHESI